MYHKWPILQRTYNEEQQRNVSFPLPWISQAVAPTLLLFYLPYSANWTSPCFALNSTRHDHLRHMNSKQKCTKSLRNNLVTFLFFDLFLQLCNSSFTFLQAEKYTFMRREITRNQLLPQERITLISQFCHYFFDRSKDLLSLFLDLQCIPLLQHTCNTNFTIFSPFKVPRALIHLHQDSATKGDDKCHITCVAGILCAL